MYLLMLAKRAMGFSCFLLSVFFIYATASAQEVLLPTDRDDSVTALSAYPVGKADGYLDLQIHRPLDPSYWSFRAGLSYGLFRTSELILNLPYAIDYEGENGFQDMTLALKQAILYEGRLHPSISLLGLYTVEGKEEISKGGGYGGGILITKKVGPFLGNINFIYFNPRRDELKDEYQVRIGGNVSIAHDFRTIIDLLVKKSVSSDEIDHMVASFGYSVSLSHRVTGYGGFGYDLKGDISSWNIFIRFNFHLKDNSNEY